MQHIPTFKEFINENINESANDYTYKEDSGGGKPTYILTLGAESWSKVKDLFDDAGRPINQDIMNYRDANGYKWELHVQTYTTSSGSKYRIYGVCGDFTFGIAPAFYQQKNRGNKKAAKLIFDEFIKKYL